MPATLDVRLWESLIYRYSEILYPGYRLLKTPTYLQYKQIKNDYGSNKDVKLILSS